MNSLVPQPVLGPVQLAYHKMRVNEIRLLLASRRQPKALPDFLGIGAAKSGTTWLHQNLRQHPEIFLPHRKELRYFDQFRLPSPGNYTKYFSPTDTRKKGEIAPTYSALSRKRIRLVRLTMPDLRLVVLLRNPIDRAWSSAQMTLSVSLRRPPESISVKDYLEFFTSPHELACGDYPKFLDSWLSYFDSEQLYIGFYEQLREHPKELLKQVFLHLGVSVHVNWDRFPYAEVIRPTLGIWQPPAPRVGPPPILKEALEDIYGDINAELCRRFPVQTRAWFPSLH